MRPVELIWKDGKKYEIERVRFIERTPAHVEGLLPVRYTCIVGGREKFIYFEPNEMRWFVEVLRER